MISALQKISTDSTVETIQRDTIAAMCIENPIPKIKKGLSNLLSTHPSIEDRISALQNY
jgi:Zn-dependent protease with chaperone function